MSLTPLCPTDRLGYLSSPGHDAGEESQEMEDDDRQIDPLMGERWSSDTLKILSSMPSRTIGGSCKDDSYKQLFRFLPAF